MLLVSCGHSLVERFSRHWRGVGGAALAALVLASALPAMASNPDHLRQLKETGNCPSCDLSGEELASMNLTGADLNHTNLSGANLNHTNLNNANLIWVNLTGAALMGANLSGASFCNTTMPDGSIRNDNC